MAFIIVDTEYTTWPGAMESGWSGPGQHREIVQIGAIRVDENFKETASVDILVRPSINPVLSELFIKLTTISQNKVDAEGVSFSKGQETFLKFCDNGGLPVICMNSDEAVFRENCKLNNIQFPFANSWHRMDPHLYKCGVSVKASGDLHALTDEPLTGHTHYALHDVRSIACWLRHARKTGKFSSLDELPIGPPTHDPRSRHTNLQ